MMTKICHHSNVQCISKTFLMKICKSFFFYHCGVQINFFTEVQYFTNTIGLQWKAYHKFHQNGKFSPQKTIDLNYGHPQSEFHFILISIEFSFPRLYRQAEHSAHCFLIFHDNSLNTNQYQNYIIVFRPTLNKFQFDRVGNPVVLTVIGNALHHNPHSWSDCNTGH